MVVIKRIIALLFTALASLLGFSESPEMTANFVVLISVIVAFTEITKEYLGKDLIQIVSWVFGSVFSIAAWYIDAGIFAGMTWYFALVTGFLASLAANGIADTKIIEAIWRYIKKINYVHRS